MALFCDLTCGVCVWHYCVILPVVCMALLCDLSCGVCGIILSPYLWYLRHYLWWYVWRYSVALPVVCVTLFLCSAWIVCFDLIVMPFFYFVLVVFVYIY